MHSILHAKFAVPALRDALLDTGHAELIEGNTWGDVYWGVFGGRGRNQLGRTLMRIRDGTRRRAGAAMDKQHADWLRTRCDLERSRRRDLGQIRADPFAALTEASTGVTINGPTPWKGIPMKPRYSAATRSPRPAGRSLRTPAMRPATPASHPSSTWMPLRRRTIERLLDDYPGEHPAPRDLDRVFRPGRASRNHRWRLGARELERRGKLSDVSECAGLLVFCQETRLIRASELPGWLYRVLYHEWRRGRLPGVNDARMNDAATRGADVLARLGLLAS